MAFFEVFIPGKEAGSPNVTLTIEAQNWIGALKSGLKSIGEGQDAIANVMCDIKEDNSIHVTDVATRRVFRLKEVSGQTAPEAPVERKTESNPTLPAAVPAVVTQPAPRPISIPEAPGFDGGPKTLLQFQAPKLPNVDEQNTSRIAAAPSMPAPSMPAPSSPPPSKAAPAASAPFVDETQKIAVSPGPAPAPVAAPAPRDPPTIETVAERSGSKSKSGTGSIPSGGAPTPRGVPAPAPKRPSGQFQSAPVAQKTEESKANPKTDPHIGRAEPQISHVSVTDAIAEVFDATQDLYLESSLTPAKIADKMLDIALTHIPAESGTFYIADVNGHELTFSAVRGPKADALKRSGMKVKIGQGIIGFCAQEGICLLVSDIAKDPRYYSQIASAIGYQPKDTLCASAEKDGRLFGALQLINSKKGFDAAHMEVARYIGLTAAALLDRLDG